MGQQKLNYELQPPPPLGGAFFAKKKSWSSHCDDQPKNANLLTHLLQGLFCGK